MFYYRCFILPHDLYLDALRNASPKFQEPSPKIVAKTCRIWDSFTQLRTLIVNISGTSQDIQNSPCLMKEVR